MSGKMAKAVTRDRAYGSDAGIRHIACLPPAVIEKYTDGEGKGHQGIRWTRPTSSAYNALSGAELGKVRVDADRSEILEIYRQILSANPGSAMTWSRSLIRWRKGRSKWCRRRSSAVFSAQCPEGGGFTRLRCPQCDPRSCQAVPVQEYHTGDAGQNMLT